MTGKQLGHFEIISKLGEGGMGVVYKARDLRLNRLVAIKVLSTPAAANVDRRSRFMQEAIAASALNHPNIVTVYDVGDNSDLPFIAMEYVEGKTLDQSIGPKGLRLSEALQYSVQVADALAAAHAAGIIHRDLKPANIAVTAKGLVKVLDFGLAKLTDPPVSSGSESTLTAGLPDPAVRTEEGTVLGSVAYMSPEQAQGKPVDGRSDIFAFGAVLYEMITGHRAFAGETKMSTLAAVLNLEPKPPSEYVAGLPRAVERIVGLCLRKDPARRFQHMEDLKIALEELKEETESGRLNADVPGAILPAPRRIHRWMLRAVAFVLAIGIAGLYWRSTLSNRSKETNQSSHLSLLVSAAGAMSQPSLSPDGKMIAYIAEDQGRFDLFVARVAGGPRIRLTNDEAREGRPRFSPDGERLAFTKLGGGLLQPEIWSVPVLGGEATRLVGNAQDATWSPDGTRLAFVSKEATGYRLATCAANGTDVHTVFNSDAAYPFNRYPAWSPDGSQLAFVRSAGGVAGEIWLVPARGGSARRLTSDSAPIFSTEPVFTADGTGIIHQSNRGGATNLWLVSLRADRLERLTAGPGPDQSPSVARNGSIAFTNGRTRCALIVQDLDSGHTDEVFSYSWYLWAPAFSPDNRDLAFSQAERDGAWHIWIVPVVGGSARQLTTGTVPQIYPRFSPDGSVYYESWSPGAERIWHVPRMGGAAEAATPASRYHDEKPDVSPDGRWLAFARIEKESTRIFVAATAGGEARRLVDVPSTLPRWSPDGKWIAFSPSRDTGAGVWIVAADGSGMRRVSETGSWPVWWPDGKRLGYLGVGEDGSQQIFAVSLSGGPPAPLRGLHFNGTNYPFDISHDGRLATSNCLDTSSEIWLLEPHGR